MQLKPEILTLDEVLDRLSKGEEFPAVRFTKEGCRVFTHCTEEEQNLFDIFGTGDSDEA